MSFRRPITPGLGALFVVLAMLAACAPRAVAPPPPVLPPASGAACLRALSERGVPFQPVSEPAAISGCNLQNAVRVTGVGAPFDKPATMTCGLALRLNEFESDVVEAAAERYFHRRVVEIYHYGAYACRNIAGTHRLSVHAHGEAIDVAGFELAGGLKILVRTDWHDPGDRGRFLHEIARGACRMFDVVLTPDSNSDHRDHIHLDLGPYRVCQT
ncbi:MAG TPA: extensin family protein [Alphaproteobacteria bacterium]|nr:extensin family protein [Alphaproteobacteria bacterium]